MKAVRYYGQEDIRVEQVPDPEILNPREAIVKITSASERAYARHHSVSISATTTSTKNTRSTAVAPDASAHCPLAGVCT